MFTITAMAMVGFTMSGDPDAAAHGRPSQQELIGDVFETRGLLGALVNPGEPSDATHVAEVAEAHAEKWAVYDTPRTNETAAVFTQLAEHAHLFAASETPKSQRVALSHVLADGDDLIVAAFGGDAPADRSGTYHQNPALDETDREPHIDVPDRQDRVRSDAPETNTTPTLGELPR